MNNTNVVRNSSIEIMRLVSMILIITHHIVGQGLGFQFLLLGGVRWLM